MNKAFHLIPFGSSLLSMALMMTACPLDADAQVAFHFNAGARSQVVSDNFFQDVLPDSLYSQDGGYLPAMMVNPFYQTNAGDKGMNSLAMMEVNNVRNVRDSYMGLATWGTTAIFDNLSIKDAEGKVAYEDDFSQDREEVWNYNGGTWTVADGQLQQTDVSNLGSLNVCYVNTGYDCTIELDATKKSGAEGFLIAFSYEDEQNYVWWNIGGWNNSQHAVEQCVDGVKSLLASAPGSIRTGKSYHLKIVMEGSHVECWMDDAKVHEFNLLNTRRLYASSSISRDEMYVYARIVNPSSAVVPTTIRMENADIVSGTVATRTLGAALTPQRLHSVSADRVTPLALDIIRDCCFEYDIQPYSLNMMRIKVKNVEDVTDIFQIFQATTASFANVYSVNGTLVRSHTAAAHATEGLPTGLYVVNGRKVWVR